MAFLYAYINGDFVLLASYGLSPVDGANWQSPDRNAAKIGNTTYDIGDLLENPITRDCAMISGPPYLRYSIGTPVEFLQWGNPDDYMALWCTDLAPRKPSGNRVKSLVRIADIASNMMELLYDIWQLENGTAHRFLPSRLSDSDNGQPYSPPGSADLTLVEGNFVGGSDIVTNFLDRTLLSRQKMQQRGQRVYFVARAWRQSIKSHQIEAVRQLKLNPPAQFVDMVSADLEKLIVKMLGKVSAACVVPVPCGHSGPGCLSCRIAQRLAERLGLPCHMAFAELNQKGSSHPKTNARRPAMNLEKAVNGPVILVDDIATSGSHIAEAARLLDGVAENVIPVVWISD